MYKIKWRGCNTAGNISWNKKANTYKELWHLLLDREIVHYEQYEKYLLDKHNIDESNFYNEDGEWLDNKYDEFIMSVPFLEEDEYKELIKSCDGNAYYQWFWEWNEELSDYVEV